jgi:Tuberculosis necrotizing toxin
MGELRRQQLKMAGGHGLATAGANSGAGLDAQADHLNNKCSYPAYVGEKLYEYWAIIETLYILSTDAAAREQFVTAMQGSAGYHALVSMGAGQAAASQNQAAGSLAIWEYFGLVEKGTSEKILREGMANAELSAKHAKIAGDKIAAALKGYVDTILKRYDDCGLLYAISTLTTDGVFFVGDLALGVGAGAVAIKGLKFVASRIAKTGAIMVTVTSSSGGILRRTFSRASLEAKYGKAQKNHMGVLEPDKNHKPKPGDKAPDKKDPKYYDKDGNPIYPPNNGFDGPVSNTTLAPGSKIDRFGRPDGRFFSDAGTPFENRAMPGGGPPSQYTMYEVLKPLPVQSGKIAPWFGQPGGGTQYVLKEGLTVQKLIDDKIIRKIDVPFR